MKINDCIQMCLLCPNRGRNVHKTAILSCKLPDSVILYFLFSSIGNLDNYNCRLFGISIGTWYSIPGPNQVSIRNLFERLATDKKDKCTLFRSEQEWKLYV